MTNEHTEIRMDGALRPKILEWNEEAIRLDVQDILKQCGMEEPEWLRAWLVSRES